MKNLIKEMEKEFDEKFPLDYFADSSMEYRDRMSEMDFARWQEKATQRAKAKKEIIKSFIFQEYTEKIVERLLKVVEAEMLDKIYYK